MEKEESLRRKNGIRTERSEHDCQWCWLSWMRIALAFIFLRFQRRQWERSEAGKTQVRQLPLLHAARISKFSLREPHSVYVPRLSLSLTSLKT